MERKRRALVHRCLVGHLFIQISCPSSLLAVQEIADPLEIAAELAARIGDLVRAPPARIPLFIEERTIDRWIGALRRSTTPPDSEEVRWLVGALLVEVLEQARSFAICHREPSPKFADADVDQGGCYEAWLRHYLGEPVDALDLYQRAVEARLGLDVQILTLARSLLGAESVAQAHETLALGPCYGFSSASDMLVATEETLREVSGRLQVLFDVPHFPLPAVVELPARSARHETAPATYRFGDSGEKALILLDTSQWPVLPRSFASLIALHEGIPGHHLEFVLHERRGRPHPVLFGMETQGFVEGWAVYAESLGFELGVLDKGIDRLSFLLRLRETAVLAQIDVGAHHLGWTQSQALDSLIMLSGKGPESAGLILSRIRQFPARMTSYFYGYEVIRGLREAWEQQDPWGFDPRTFHQAVLSLGRVPLGVLRTSMVLSKRLGGDRPLSPTRSR